MSFAWLMLGMVRVGIWWAGAVLAFYRKRLLVACGFGLGGALAVVRAAQDSGAKVPEWLQQLTGLLGTAVAGLIVMGFVYHQSRARPDRWSP